MTMKVATFFHIPIPPGISGGIPDLEIANDAPGGTCKQVVPGANSNAGMVGFKIVSAYGRVPLIYRDAAHAGFLPLVARALPNLDGAQNLAPGTQLKQDCIDPFTHRMIAESDVDYSYLVGVVRQMRGVLREIRQRVLEMLDGGTDPLLVAQYIEFKLQRGRWPDLMNYLEKIALVHEKNSGSKNVHAALLHRLKQPITALRMMGEMLEDGYSGEDSAFNGIRNAVQFGAEVTIDALFREMQFVMSVLAQKVWNDRGTSGELVFDKGISSPIIDKQLGIDWDCIEEITEELITNAIKYGEFVHVSWDEKTNSIVVTNNGPGIPEGLDVFAPGVRGVHNGVFGTGLGLSNARRDARESGMELSYVSSVANGVTEFRLSFKPA